MPACMALGSVLHINECYLNLDSSCQNEWPGLVIFQASLGIPKFVAIDTNHSMFFS